MKEKECIKAIRDTAWFYVFGCIILICSMFTFIFSELKLTYILFILGFIFISGSLAINIIVRLRHILTLIEKGEKY